MVFYEICSTVFLAAVKRVEDAESWLVTAENA